MVNKAVNNQVNLDNQSIKEDTTMSTELTGNNVLHSMANRRFVFTNTFIVTPFSLNGRNQLLKTPLIVAVQQRETLTFTTLLELQPDLNCQDWKGDTALHHYVHRQENEFLKILLIQQPDATIFNNG